MPTYDYVCDACGHAFELFQPMMDPVKRKCPKCKKSKLRRLIGAGAAIMFKGSGFYKTDYRSESYKKQAVGSDYASWGISYRTDSGVPAPTSWLDLFKPEYAGKVIVPNITASGGFQTLVMMAGDGFAQ